MIHFPFLCMLAEIPCVYQDGPRSTRAAEIPGVTSWGFLHNCHNQAVFFSSLIMNARFFQCQFAGEGKSWMITFLCHMADSWGFALPDFDGIVPDVLSKLMYKWSSYIRMSMYSWRQAKITVNSGAKMIDKCQSSHALVGVSWLEEVTPWVKSRQNWCTYCLRIFPRIRIPEGNDKYKKTPKLLTTSWAIWHKKTWWNMKNVD